MKSTRAIGIVLVGLGAVLIILGLTASRSLANTLSNTFLGHLTENTTLYIIGGIASVVVGLLLTISSSRS